MLRLFYLLLFPAVIVAPYGCAGTVFWLGGDPDTTVNDVRGAEATVAVSDADTTTTSPPVKGAPERQTNAVNAAIDGAQNGAIAQRSTDDGTRGAVVVPSKVGASADRMADRATNADPLAAEVRALGFEGAAEEASAMAALATIQDPKHRDVLLRTMRASLAMRNEQAAQPNALAESAGASVPSASRSATATDEVHGAMGHVAVEQPAVGERPEPQKSIRAAGASARQDAARRRSADNVRQVDYRDSRTDIETELAEAEEALTGGWRNHLSLAISELETELSESDDATARGARGKKLRMLYLLAGRRDDALRPIEGATAAEREFWTKELYGLSSLLDDTKPTSAKQSAAVAVEHLRHAADHLGELSGLAVKKLHFCTEVKAYGTFIPFTQDEFRMGQEVLLYCEVENFHSKLTEKGYHTALEARYEIFDSSGSRIAEKGLGRKEEHCQNRRRDFFVPYFLYMPKQVPPGKYQLKLTIEDVHAGQTAESTIEFGIREK